MRAAPSRRWQGHSAWVASLLVTQAHATDPAAGGGSRCPCGAESVVVTARLGAPGAFKTVSLALQGNSVFAGSIQCEVALAVANLVKQSPVNPAKLGAAGACEASPADTPFRTAHHQVQRNKVAPVRRLVQAAADGAKLSTIGAVRRCRWPCRLTVQTSPFRVKTAGFTSIRS